VSDPGSGTVEVRPGRTIAWTAVGDGPPLLLVNGYAATGADWDPSFLGLLAARHRVICPDNVGLGASTLAADDEVGGAEGMAADMLALLDALEVERAAVVGWSMGGFVAQTLARRAPDRVTALGLIATHTGGPDCVNGPVEVARELVDHSGTPRQQATRLISLLFPPSVAPEFDQRFGELVAAARAALPERILFMQEEALGSWHKRPTPLPVLDPPLPTAIVHGGLDTVVPPGNAAVLAAVHPGATVEIRPACAHAVMAQEPDAVATAILAATAG
jgi:pimeloyl-ACP methyl ester carboxylesterase